MKVIVDDEICTGCEICADTCPEIFSMQGEVAFAASKELPHWLEEDCEEMAEDCPAGAIGFI